MTMKGSIAAALLLLEFIQIAKPQLFDEKPMQSMNLTVQSRDEIIPRIGRDDIRHRRSPRQANGDVYEFHRFQHYGFKTPAPSTFSLEGMLAFLAPLATIPIIASAALSGLATILPNLTRDDRNDSVVSGRRGKRDVLIDALHRMSSSSNSSAATIDLKSYFRRDIRDLDIIQKYLKKANPREDYNDEIMATYLRCSGMLDYDNHCLERLVCQFSDPNTRMDSLEKDVSSLIIYTIINNKHIREDFKDRLRKAAVFGRDRGGRCGFYACSREHFTSV